MANLTGSPKVVVDVVDKSLILVSAQQGIIAVQGETARGESAVPMFVRNRTEFLRDFGGRIDDSDFPLYCLRLLDAGAKLWVSRVSHYSDITDKSTIEGTKATAKVTDGGAVETLGTAAAEVTASGAMGDIWTYTVDEGSGVQTISTYTEGAADTPAIIAQGIIDNMTGGYTAVIGVAGAFTVTARANTGATSSTFAITFQTDGTGTETNDATFAGGVDAVEKGIYFEAKDVGAGYNGTTITVSDPASGLADVFDIVVLATDSENAQTVVNFPKAPTQTDIDSFNEILRDIQILYVVNDEVVTGSSPLAGGVQDVTNIVDQDFIGNATSMLGWNSFGNVVDALRIANIGRPSPDVDIALSAYTVGRGDMIFHVGTPIGVTPDGAKDYRLGEGIYSHTAIDAFQGQLTSGQVNITDPDDSTKRFDIPGIVDFLGLRARVDNDFGPWISCAGGKRGKVFMPNNGVGDVNFASPANKDAFDDAYINGVNAMLDDPTFQTVYWGNKSLLLDRSKLTNKQNVADGAIFIARALEPLVRTELFDPNDTIMWKQIYRNVQPFITNTLEAGRCIQPGENERWFWIGDQNADRIEDAEFNQQEDINNGIFRARFVYIPITATEFIGIDVVVTDSNTVASIVENPTF